MFSRQLSGQRHLRFSGTKPLVTEVFYPVWNGSQESINHDDEFYYILGFLPLPQCAVCREFPQTGPVARLRRALWPFSGRVWFQLWRCVFVERLFSKSPGPAPYGARSACAIRAAHPPPHPVVPDPESRNPSLPRRPIPRLYCPGLARVCVLSVYF